jgi:hypothetical protein
VIGALLEALFSSPLRAAIIVGLAVAIGVGYFSLPEPKLIKSAAEVTPARLLSGEEGARLHTAFRSARDGNGQLVELSEDEFKAQALPFIATFPAEQSGNRFFLRHVGQAELGSSTVYVWEETLFAAPWWSPHRFVYKALEAETGAFGEVVRLTFERDVGGLIALLIFDAIIGFVYGALVGLIVAVRKINLSPPATPERRTNLVTSWSPPVRPQGAQDAPARPNTPRRRRLGNP